jgi:hypothetical protein
MASEYKRPVVDEWWVEFEDCNHVAHWPNDWPEGHGQSAPSYPQAVARCYLCNTRNKKNPFEYQRVKAIATKQHLLGE